MKALFPLLVFFSSLALFAADAPAPGQPRDDYAAFLAQCVKKENVAECIALMDRLIIDGEHGLVDNEPDQGLVDGTTSFGLRIEFSTTETKEVILYYLRISRGGKDMRYADAINFVALFTDRAGLPHPVEVVEGDHSVFYAQWLIKPSDWKDFHKMIVKVRAENHTEKDLEKVFVNAIGREVNARAENAAKNQR